MHDASRAHACSLEARQAASSACRDAFAARLVLTVRVLFLCAAMLVATAGPRQLQCSVTTHVSQLRSLYGMLAMVCGVALVLLAPELTRSIYFRITSGALLFASGFMLVLLFMTMRWGRAHGDGVCLWMRCAAHRSILLLPPPTASPHPHSHPRTHARRSVPYKRALSGALLVSTSSLLALVRWAYGVWWPGVQPLLHSPLVLWYFGVMGLAGAAVTYWFDDPANVKLMTSIRAALQLAGLGVVYASLADSAAGVAAVLLLATSPLTLGLCGWLWRLLRYLVALGVRLQAARTPRTPRRQQQAQQQQRQRLAGADGVSLVCSEDGYQLESGLLAAGSGGAGAGRDGEGEGEGDYDSEEDESYEAGGSSDGSQEDDDEEEGSDDEASEAEPQPPAREQPQPAPPRGWRDVWPWQPSQPAAAAAAATVPAAARAAATPAAAAPAAAPALRQQAPGPGARVLSPTAPPPLGPGVQAHAQAAAGGAEWSWSSPARTAVDLSTRTPPTHAQQQQQQQQQQGEAGTWGAAQVVFNTTRRTPPQQPGSASQARATPQSAAAAGGRRAPAAAAAAAGGRQPSPLVSPGAGKITNPRTGREINVGGPTYNELIAQGFSPDWLRNTLVPPERERAAAHGGGGGAGAGRAPPRASPAGNVRRRSGSSKP
jgi:hypothetical protein